jgi:PAS domain S-box-containing protein
MRFQQFLNAIIDPVLLIPIDPIDRSLFVAVNDAAIERYGFSCQEFKTKSLADLSLDLDLIDFGTDSSAPIRSIYRGQHCNKRGDRFPVAVYASTVEFDQCSYRMLTVRALTAQAEVKTVLEKTNDRFFQASPDAIILSRLSDGRFYEINESFTRLLGYQPQEVVGKTSIELQVWKRDADRQFFVDQIRRDGVVHNFEARFIRRDGTLFCGLISARVNEVDGQSLIFSIVRDISERKRMEEALRHKNLLLEKMTGAAKAGIVQIDQERRVVFWNRAAAAILGCSEKDAMGRGFQQVFFPESSSTLLLKHFAELKTAGGETGFEKPLELEVQRKDGRLVIIEFSPSLFEYDGQMQRMGVFRDITERKKAEEETALLHFAMDHVRDEVHLVDRNLQLVYVNHEACRMTGYSREKLLRMKTTDLVPEKTLEFRADITRRLGANETVNFEGSQWRCDGSSYPVEVTVNPFWYRNAPYSFVLVRDITERKRVDKEMRLMTFALDHICEEVHLSDENYRFVYVNQEACRAMHYSREELLGLTIPEIVPERTLEFLEKSKIDLKNRKTIVTETMQKSSDGNLYPVEVTSNYFEYDGSYYNLTLVRDITERKQVEMERFTLERQMVQAQKLESLEVLAGGVAHDFNNLLAAILGHAELLRRRLPPHSQGIKNLQQIKQASERAADLAKQMLAYSGKGKFVVETIDLNLLLEEIQQMIRVSVSRKIAVEYHPYHPLPGVDVDATQIHQIIMNLIINAAEAIGDNSGVITISTSCLQCGQAYLKKVWTNEELVAGRYVSLVVTDNGCGMDDETLSKLFDPFFSTKFTGRGLGMSAVMGIVRGHRGAIKVESQKDRGTTFSVLLPASDKPLKIAVRPEVDENWKGEGVVLLVDDEDAVLQSSSEMLKGLGFTTLLASDGQQALQLFREHPGINLVLLDLIMPNLDGEKCFHELRKLDPSIKVVIVSGYCEADVEKIFDGKEIAGFLQKPYDLSLLVELISGLEGAVQLKERL